MPSFAACFSLMEPWPLNVTPPPQPRDPNAENEKLLRLKQKVDTLGKENAALKKSVYELSTHSSHGFRRGPIVIDPESSHDQREIDDTEVSRVILEASALGDDLPRKDTIRAFHVKYELKGHAGAVYTGVFSP